MQAVRNTRCALDLHGETRCFARLVLLGEFTTRDSGKAATMLTRPAWAPSARVDRRSERRGPSRAEALLLVRGRVLAD